LHPLGAKTCPKFPPQSRPAAVEDLTIEADAKRPRPPQGPPPPEVMEAQSPTRPDWQKAPMGTNRIMADRSAAPRGNPSNNSHDRFKVNKDRRKLGNTPKKKIIPAYRPADSEVKPEANLKRTIPAWTGAEGDSSKKQRVSNVLLDAATDAEGRQYNLQTVVVNFANVGATYAKKVLKRDARGIEHGLFDWEGVRRCVTHLTQKSQLSVVGVIYENFWGTDNDSPNKVEIPDDIRLMCESLEETPRLQGMNHKSADDEMTIKCAYHRNCRFLDNDNYRDWKAQLKDEQIRAWLEQCQDFLHMKYFIDSGVGVFDVIEGNIPDVLLALKGTGMKIPAAGINKRALHTSW